MNEPIMDDEGFAKELGKVMEEGEKISKLRPVLSQPIQSPPMPNNSPLTPSGIAKAVAAATDPDTDRSTRMMGEQMEKIIAGLETEIKEAEEVKALIERRIANLYRSLKVSKEANEGLRQNAVK